MAHPFQHCELSTTDVGKAKVFYQQLFQWQLQDLDSMPYTIINTGGAPGGGIMKNPVPGAPSMWLTYVLVDEIGEATKKAKSLGANVLKDVTEVPGFGWLSIIADPTGAVLGLWQNKS